MMKKIIVFVACFFLILSCSNKIKFIECFSSDSSLIKFKNKENKVKIIRVNSKYIDEFNKIKELSKLKGVDEFLGNSEYNYAIVFCKDTIYTNSFEKADSKKQMKVWNYKNKTFVYTSNVFTIDNFPN